jgi:hypothetical protein
VRLRGSVGGNPPGHAHTLTARPSLLAAPITPSHRRSMVNAINKIATTYKDAGLTM